jgi:pre-mRNA-splicing helicase BRR2
VCVPFFFSFFFLAAVVTTMADAPKFVNYSLKTNSVVVLQTENRVRVTGPRGDPETLRGRLAGTFGDRAQPNRPQENNKKRKKDQDRYDAGNKRPKTLGGDILASGYFEGAYRPKTRETKAVHQQLLNFVEQFLGDVEISIIFSATDELLGILKADNMKPSDKEAAVSQLLGAPTPQDKYTELIRLGKLITDFSDDTENGEDGAGDDRGISVVIGDEVCTLVHLATNLTFCAALYRTLARFKFCKNALLVPCAFCACSLDQTMPSPQKHTVPIITW